MKTALRVLAGLCVVLALGACSKSKGNQFELPTFDGGPTDAAERDGSLIPFPDSAIGTMTLTVTRVAPSSGSFQGGDEVVIRGSGFSATDEIFFDGAQVQPADVELIDGNRLKVVVPAGTPGPADVRVQKTNSDSATLTGGYTYEAISLTPRTGPIGGGTRVEILAVPGMELSVDDQITFGHSACTNVVSLNPTRLACRTPAMAAGTVDVTITRASDGSTIIAKDAFTYFDSTDPYGGGLGGGPLTGTLTVTVLDDDTGLPVPEACVVVGNPATSAWGGQTNAAGQISFSDEALMGPHNVTAGKHCYERSTFIDADASQITMFIRAWRDLRCGTPGTPTGGPGRFGSFVEGELVWKGSVEYGPNPWDNVPPARANEVRVSYVFPTKPTMDSNIPDPDQGSATIQRVLEGTVGERGYPYRIFVAPGGMAVYALSGLENTTTGEFVPYVMGVGRNVLVAPGETAGPVDIAMDYPLDQRIDVNATLDISRGRTGPDRFQLRAAVDLGGEGVIFPIVNNQMYNVVNARSVDRALRLVAQPLFTEDLADARYTMDLTWGTGEALSAPLTALLRTGIAGNSGTVVLGGFLGLPQATEPAYGDALPNDRVLRWTADGAPPDVHVTFLTGSDGNSAWCWYSPGTVREVPVYDFSESETCSLEDVTEGFLPWTVYGLQTPGFPYETFSYQQLNSRYWTAYAVDSFLTRR